MTVRMDVRRVESVEELIDQIRKDYENWKTSTFPWFRGEAAYPKYYYSKDGHSELVPTLTDTSLAIDTKTVYYNNSG